MWLHKLHSTFRDIIIINVWTNLEPYHLNFQYDRTVSFEKKRTQHQWCVYLQQTEQKFVLKLRNHCSGLVTYRGLAVTSGKSHSIPIRTLKCSLSSLRKAPMGAVGTGQRRNETTTREAEERGIGND